jgi:hypothetical protein
MEAVLSVPPPAALDAAPHPAPAAPFWLRLGPIVFFEIYLNLSLALFALGPWKWPLSDTGRLYVFVGAAHLALLAGYLSGMSGRARGYTGKARPETLLRLSILLTLVLYLPTLYTWAGGYVDPIGAIRDPGEIYYRFQANLAAANTGARPVALLTYIRMLGAPLLAILMPLLANRWSHISRTQRLLGVVAVLSNVSLFVFTGRNKGLIDFVLLAPWFFVILARSGRVRISMRRVVFGAVVCVAGLAFFADFFSRGNVTRQGGVDIAFENVRVFGGLTADLEHPLVRSLSPENKGVVLGLTFTQVHGYYALSRALEKPFEPAWGVGHSAFLQQMERRFTGRTDLGDHSYPARLEAEEGWSATEFWHTAYTWLASDLSFPGTVVLMLLLGRLLARAWNDTLRGENPYAMGFLVILVTMFYYLPTNNIVLGFGESWAAFWSMLAAWWVTQRRIRVRAAVPVAYPGAALG